MDAQQPNPAGSGPPDPVPTPAPTPVAKAASEAVDAASHAAGELKEQVEAVASPAKPDVLKAAEAAIANARAKNSQATPVDLPSFSNRMQSPKAEGIDLLADVNLHVKIELGRTRMLVEDVLRLNEGSVVELDKLAGDPVDVYVNDRRVARGEVLVLNDNFCVRIHEIIAPVGGEAAA